MKKFSDGPDEGLLLKLEAAFPPPKASCPTVMQAWRDGYDAAATEADAIEKRLEGAIKAMEWAMNRNAAIHSGDKYAFACEILRAAIARAKGEGHE